jgi:hypothetical protein
MTEFSKEQQNYLDLVEMQTVKLDDYTPAQKSKVDPTSTKNPKISSNTYDSLGNDKLATDQLSKLGFDFSILGDWNWDGLSPDVNAIVTPAYAIPHGWIGWPDQFSITQLAKTK